METFLVAILCFAVIALAIKISRLSDTQAAIAELGDLIRRLDQRLVHLERHVAAQASHDPVTVESSEVAAPPASTANFIVPTGTIPPAPIHQPRIPTPPAPPAPPSPPVITPAPAPATRSISLEERLGQNWLSKIGIILVVLGVATFLGYKLVTLGPLGKSLTGLVTALAILGGGLFLERKPTYRTFARAAIGGGWALLFFVTFALYHVDAMQVLSSQTADLILMAAVASVMVWHSLRYKSQVVTALAFLLAFATVAISHITLFSLVAGAILAIALVYIAAREYWFELGLAGLCGVYINHFLWLLRVLPNGGLNGIRPGYSFPDLLPSVGLLFLYWLIFRLFYIFRVPPPGDQQRNNELIASITAILNSIGLLALLKYQSSHPEWAFRVLLVLGTIEFVFAFIARTRWRTAFLVLATLASALLLAAIPFRFSKASWTLLWLFEAEALFMAGIFIRERVLRRIGLIAGFAASFKILLLDLLVIFSVSVFTDKPSDPHTSTTISLLTAAILFWFNSEFARRRWNDLFADAFDDAALTLTSYAAALSMAGALWLWVPATWLTIAWGILGLALFEAGILLHRSSLRNQAYAVFAATFLRLFAYDLNFSMFGTNTTAANHHLHTVLPLIAAYIWIYHRTHTVPAASTLDRAVGTLAAWLGITAATTLIYLELRTEFITIGWSVLALILISAAWLLRRPIFTAQALVLLGVSALRALSFNLFNATNPATAFWNTRATTVSVTCAVMLLCLPMAFAIRRSRLALDAAPSQRDPWHLVLTHPEQPFFFVPYALIAILIAFELRTGMITLGWIALGLVAFLAALPIGERSYRLAGLGLLLVGLTKIVLIDIWSLSTTDRIITLIATGVVLLLVSFLYSRYRETILKFL